MLYALHTGADAPLYRRRRKRMHGDVSPPILGRFDSSPEFRLGESRHIDRAERRGNTATGRQFDLGGALHELLAHANANLVWAVGDHAAANLLHAAEHTADRSRQIGQLAKIPVPARDGDHGARRIDARALDDSFINGLLETKRRPA